MAKTAVNKATAMMQTTRGESTSSSRGAAVETLGCRTGLGILPLVKTLTENCLTVREGIELRDGCLQGRDHFSLPAQSAITLTTTSTSVYGFFSTAGAQPCNRLLGRTKGRISRRKGVHEHENHEKAEPLDFHAPDCNNFPGRWGAVAVGGEEAAAWLSRLAVPGDRPEAIRPDALGKPCRRFTPLVARAWRGLLAHVYSVGAFRLAGSELVQLPCRR
jgi:hypothetical protein